MKRRGEFGKGLIARGGVGEQRVERMKDGRAGEKWRVLFNQWG